MNAPDRDEEFAAFLKRRTLLPELPHQPEKLEPPAELDERVLSQARAAIHAQRQPVRVARWARPVALAATILLCLSIVLNITLNTRHPAATTPRSGFETAIALPASQGYATVTALDAGGTALGTSSAIAI